MFSYALWSPPELASFFNESLKETLTRCNPCVLKGYQRMFAGLSDQWEGTSIPTLIQEADSEVRGFFIRLTDKEIDKIDAFETLVNPVDVKMSPKDGAPDVEGVAFVIDRPNKFVYPSFKQLQAIAETDSAYYYLDGDITEAGESKSIEVSITDATTKKQEGEERVDLSRKCNQIPSLDKEETESVRSQRKKAAAVTDYKPTSLSLKGNTYLKSTGVIGAYQKLLTNLYSNGWPKEKGLFNYCADEILRHGSQYQKEFKGIIGKEYEKKTRMIQNNREEALEEERIERSRMVLDEQYQISKSSFALKSLSALHKNTKKSTYDLSIFANPRVPLRTNEPPSQLNATGQGLHIEGTRPIR